MSKILLVAVILSVLMVATIGTVMFVKANQTPTNTTQEPKITSCSGCGNKCTLDNNCGSTTCGAKTGGACTCGQAK